jgi:hypothetical protein
MARGHARPNRRNGGLGLYQDGRRPSAVPAPVAADPELSGRPGRRTFTAQVKLLILKEADQAAGTGEIGAILRRRGHYSSALSGWRRQGDVGTLGARTPARRGPKLSDPSPLTAELAACWASQCKGFPRSKSSTSPCLLAPPQGLGGRQVRLSGPTWGSPASIRNTPGSPLYPSSPMPITVTTSRNSGIG